MERKSKYENLEIVRSNSFIKKSNMFTALEQKIILTTVAQQKITDEGFYEYKFTVKELSKLFNMTDKALYASLKNISKSLSTKVMGYINDDVEEFEFAPMFSLIRYKDSELFVSFNQRLNETLLGLKEQFTMVQLETIVKLKTKSAMRLYELLMVGQNKNGKRGLWRMDFKSLDNFKEEMGLVAKDGSLNYPRWIHLKQFVITPAIGEINKLTDIEVSYTPIKKGRSFSNIIFEVKRKKIAITKEESSMEEKVFIRLDRKLEKSSVKSKKRFEEILKDFNKQPNMFIKDPEIKAQSDYYSALILWNKELSK